MVKIHYLKGDATQPVGDGIKFICHICNNVGAWGAGFVLALSNRWRAPEEQYRSLKIEELQLGRTYLVPVGENTFVANMIAQHGVGHDEDGNPPIRYGAVRACLNRVNDTAYRMKGTLHMPRIGCGLAGGKWEEIEKIIKEVASVDVYVYDPK